MAIGRRCRKYPEFLTPSLRLCGELQGAADALGVLFSDGKKWHTAGGTGALLCGLVLGLQNAKGNMTTCDGRQNQPDRFLRSEVVRPRRLEGVREPTGSPPRF